MAVYIPKQKKVLAEQWIGHGVEFSLTDFDGNPIEVFGIDGTSGYNRKLGYLRQNGKNPVTVRPMSWLMVDEYGRIDVLTDDQFREKYQLSLDQSPAEVNKPVENPRKTRQNKAKDNTADVLI